MEHPFVGFGYTIRQEMIYGTRTVYVYVSYFLWQNT